MQTVDTRTLQALAGRGKVAQARLSAVCGTSAQDVLIRIVSDALAFQHVDGSWGSDDYPTLKPVFTAQMIETLEYLGIDVAFRDATEASSAATPVIRAVRWLDAVQQEPGSWGEDAWDTSQVIKALWKAGLREDDRPVEHGLNYLRRTVDAGWPNRRLFWYGPGFYGGALEVFNIAGDGAYAGKTLDQLWAFYDHNDGAFRPPPPSTAEGPTAPTVWHTANALIGLRSFASVMPNTEELSLSIDWLRNAQSADGSWCPGHSEITCYCTIQAIIALTLIDGPTSPAAHKGTDWFVDFYRADSSISNLTTTLMGAAAIARTRRRTLVAEADFVFINELASVLDGYSDITAALSTERDNLLVSNAELSADIETLRATETVTQHRIHELETTRREQTAALADTLKRAANAEEELQKYALKLSNNQLAVLGTVLTIVTFALGTLLAVILAS